MVILDADINLNVLYDRHWNTGVSIVPNRTVLIEGNAKSYLWRLKCIPEARQSDRRLTERRL